MEKNSKFETFTYNFLSCDVAIFKEQKKDLFEWLFVSLIVNYNIEHSLPKESYTIEVKTAVEQYLKEHWNNVKHGKHTIKIFDEFMLTSIESNIEKDFVRRKDPSDYNSPKILNDKAFNFIKGYNNIFNDEVDVFTVFFDPITNEVVPYITHEYPNAKNVSNELTNPNSKYSAFSKYNITEESIKRAYNLYQKLKDIFSSDEEDFDLDDQIDYQIESNDNYIDDDTLDSQDDEEEVDTIDIQDDKNEDNLDNKDEDDDFDFFSRDDDDDEDDDEDDADDDADDDMGLDFLDIPNRIQHKNKPKKKKKQDDHMFDIMPDTYQLYSFEFSVHIDSNGKYICLPTKYSYPFNEEYTSNWLNYWFEKIAEKDEDIKAVKQSLDDSISIKQEETSNDFDPSFLTKSSFKNIYLEHCYSLIKNNEHFKLNTKRYKFCLKTLTKFDKFFESGKKFDVDDLNSFTSDVNFILGYVMGKLCNFYCNTDISYNEYKCKLTSVGMKFDIDVECLINNKEIYDNYKKGSQFVKCLLIKLLLYRTNKIEKDDLYTDFVNDIRYITDQRNSFSHDNIEVTGEKTFQDEDIMCIPEKLQKVLYCLLKIEQGGY